MPRKHKALSSITAQQEENRQKMQISQHNIAE
jgi:hypothetical protein